MMPPKPIRENPITHIGFTVDSSGSMRTKNLLKNFEIIHQDGAKILIDPKATMFLLIMT